MTRLGQIQERVRDPLTAFKALLRQAWRVIPPMLRGDLLHRALRGITDAERFALGVPTVIGLLENARSAGFLPGTVVDVGANVGKWTRSVSGVFPQAHFIMFEANADHESALQRCRADIRAPADYAITLLGPGAANAVTFYKLGDGSSVLPELTSFERTAVSLPMRTLDACMSEHAYTLPLLLKLDVQGFELEVLRGAPQLLEQAEFIILEASLLPYNAGSPLLGDVIAFMAERDFVIFDVCGQARREIDGVLFQLDVAFVKTASTLRSARKFWLREP